MLINSIEKGHHILLMKIPYLPAQGRQVQNKEWKHALLANLEGYLQNLLLIWLYFSITRKCLPQGKYIFLDVFESLVMKHIHAWGSQCFCEVSNDELIIPSMES
jgi:hypothetical protein